MKLNEFQKRVLRLAGIRLAVFFVNLLLRTVKIEIRNREAIEKLESDGRNFVVAFWHGSMLIGWYIHRKYKIAALVSKSQDGEVLARVLEKWDYKVIRGSSHVGGSEALLMMTEQLENGYCLSITPDGPRGPIYKFKAGAVVAAKRTEVPLILAGIGMCKKFVLKSWDRFEIPKPFSRVFVVYDEPVYVDPKLSFDETNSLIQGCEEKLNMLQKEALNNCST